MSKTISLINKSMVETGAARSIDRAQKNMGSYWHLGNDTLEKISGNSEVFSVDVVETEIIDNFFQTRKETIEITYAGNATSWKKKFNRFLEGTVYSNLYTVLVLPNADLDSSVFDDDAIDVESFYNYEFYNYEAMSYGMEEKLLPSYLLFNYADTGYDSTKKKYIRTYNGEFSDEDVHGKMILRQIDNIVYNKNLFPPGIKQELIHSQDEGFEVKHKSNNYYNFFYNFIENSGGLTPEGTEISEKSSNIFVLYKPNATRLDYLPHYNRIKIPVINPATSQLFDSTQIDDALIDNRLMSFLFKFIKRTRPEEIDFHCKISGEYIGEKKIKTWNLLQWWTSGEIDSIEEQSDEIFLFNEADMGLQGASAILERRLRKVIALGKIRNQIRTGLHNFEDVLNSTVNHRSLIGYKIEKFLSDPSSAAASPIQTFYFESNGRVPVELIDTQVSFDTKYYYSISALVVSLGCSYSYTNERGTNKPKTMAYDVYISPDLKIIEIPLHEIATRIIEPPPLRPHVSVANEKFRKNKVKFFIQDKLGEVRDEYSIEKYIEITSADTTYREKLIDNYNRIDGKFFYSSRAASGNFEVYKLDKKPTKYSDFASGYLGNIKESTSYDSASSAIFEDFIEHEKKYYYLFRALTPHLRASNPSFVYEVYLIPDADEVKLILDAFPIIESKKETDFAIDMRRFLQIIPNFQHTILEDSRQNQTPITNNPVLGKAMGEFDPSLWDYNDYRGNYIKLRLTSKSSGRKIDLNLVFKVKNLEELD